VVPSVERQDCGDVLKLSVSVPNSDDPSAKPGCA
jgi:hypothetical protein